jgi:hypothetical protein
MGTAADGNDEESLFGGLQTGCVNAILGSCRFYAFSHEQMEASKMLEQEIS